MSRFTKNYIFPLAVKEMSGEIQNIQALLMEKHLQIALRESDVCTVNGKGHIIFDFGKEYAGGIRILSHYFHNAGSDCTAPIRIRFGESISETCAEIGEKGACNDHSPRDFSLRLPQLSDVEFGATGFRFVRIDFLSEAKISLKAFCAAFCHIDRNFSGGFQCDDELVNQIYETARRTAYLCVQNDMVYDGIKRDRLVWEGDLHTEMLSLVYSFGALDCVENALRFVKEQNPLPSWMAGMPSYSMWWIITLYDYFLRTDKIGILEENASYVQALVLQFSRCLCDGHLMFDKGARFNTAFFLDWPSFCDPPSAALVDSNVSLLIVAMRAAVSILQNVKKSTKEAVNMLAILCRIPVVRTAKKQFLSMSNWAGRQMSQADAICLASNESGELSTFMSYYILKAICNVEPTFAMREMRDYFGGMLSCGATTFWEDFDRKWLIGSGRIDEFCNCGKKDIHGDFGAFCYRGFRHSLCHGWASGPVPYLSESVAGIQVLSPGFREVLISPNLSGLKFVSIDVPVPEGNLKVTHEVKGKDIYTSITAPDYMNIHTKGCKAQIQQ